jgi:hypothetical protein
MHSEGVFLSENHPHLKSLKWFLYVEYIIAQISGRWFVTHWFYKQFFTAGGFECVLIKKMFLTLSPYK